MAAIPRHYVFDIHSLRQLIVACYAVYTYVRGEREKRRKGRREGGRERGCRGEGLKEEEEF